MGEVLGTMTSDEEIRTEALQRWSNILEPFKNHGRIHIEIDNLLVKVSLDLGVTARAMEVRWKDLAKIGLGFGHSAPGMELRWPGEGHAVGAGIDQFHQEALSAVTKLGFRLVEAEGGQSECMGRFIIAKYTFEKPGISMEDMKSPWWTSMRQLLFPHRTSRITRTVGTNTDTLESMKIQALAILRISAAPPCVLPPGWWPRPPFDEAKDVVSSDSVLISLGAPCVLVESVKARITHAQDAQFRVIFPRTPVLKVEDCQQIISLMTCAGYSLLRKPKPSTFKLDGSQTEASALWGEYVFTKLAENDNPHDDPSDTNSVSSTSEGGTQRASVPKCYTPNTAFKIADGTFCAVQNSWAGMPVIASMSLMTYVVQIKPCSKQRVCVVQLVTRKASIKVSACHRVIALKKDSENLVICYAHELKADEDKVKVGETMQKLTAVHTNIEKTELFEVSFCPDVPVETFQLPQFGIHTQGEPTPFDGQSSKNAELCQVFGSRLEHIREADLLQCFPEESELQLMPQR